MNRLNASLCGHFFVSRPDFSSLASLGWEQYMLSIEEREDNKLYYYPEFVDFCYADSPQEGCVEYRKTIDRSITVELKGSKMNFHVDLLHLYVFPSEVAIFSVHIKAEHESMNNFTNLLFNLRSPNRYDDKGLKEWRNLIIGPMMECRNCLSYSQSDKLTSLVENGNKLRIFQIIDTDDNYFKTLEDTELECLLYELGTLSKVTLGKFKEEPLFSESYMKHVIEHGRISIFNNWNALALMDTFSILSCQAQPWMISNWEDCYFRMIYLHSLFMKCYLFNLNLKFRKQLSGRYVHGLIGPFDHFSLHYCFYRIAYNFLPLEIDKSIDRGLELNEEMSQLYAVIKKENTKREEKSDRRMNSLLTVLSLLTIISAIWDFSCLLDRMYPYSEIFGTQILGYRTVVLLCATLFAVLSIFIYGKKDR